MKVILMQELKGRGGEGDVIDVARGFAVNYLLPRKIAIEATPGNVKQLEQRMHNITKRENQRMGDAETISASLNDKVVTIAAKVGEEGRLFGSVTAVMVHEAILEQLGVDIDRRKIETHGHIKDAGAHIVDVSIYREVKAQVTVNVVPEGGATVTTTAAAPADVAEAASDTADQPLESEDEEMAPDVADVADGSEPDAEDAQE
jgi:large subunit ribosomal protein L9